jgi:hypothetical protein
MDWQQGRRTAGSDLDPLWWLNHLHFLDLGRNPARRSFAFSRWGGLGSHRYPVGFSGDTVVSWRSLAFQVHFTATAANVAFGWWSHDIGGHMEGIEDAELYVRWLQFGVFSPILRLHSTQNPFHERRPWGWDAQTLALARSAMRLRHALIPLSVQHGLAGTPGRRCAAAADVSPAPGRTRSVRVSRPVCLRQRADRRAIHVPARSGNAPGPAGRSGCPRGTGTTSSAGSTTPERRGTAFTADSMTSPSLHVPAPSSYWLMSQQRVELTTRTPSPYTSFRESISVSSCMKTTVRATATGMEPRW